MLSLEKKVTFSEELFYKAVQEKIGQKKAFQTWFSRTRVGEIRDDQIVLFVSNALALDWIKKQYFPKLNQMVSENWDCELLLEVDAQLSSVTGAQSTVVKVESTERKSAHVETQCGDGRYAFDKFVVGPENQMAFVASQGLATGQAHVLSPLVLSGGHGTGKTHLASAIYESFSKSQALRMQAEEFSNAYIQAVRSEGAQDLDGFRAMIRSKRIVVIEDLDFFLEGNKKKTIDELLHSLVVLKREMRHVVITSNQPAYRFESISPKLAHFLMDGLTVKLGDLTKATREKLLVQCCRSMELSLSAKCMDFVAGIAFRSPRELESAVKQLQAYAAMGGEKLASRVVRELLSDHLRMDEGGQKEEGAQDLHDIAKHVAELFGVSVAKLVSASRERHVTLARHTAMSCSYERRFTLKQIGDFYGGRLHQSVLFATKKVAVRRQKDLDYQRTYRKLQSELKLSLS
jgi:chromosomal replication initiator protein